MTTSSDSSRAKSGPDGTGPRARSSAPACAFWRSSRQRRRRCARHSHPVRRADRRSPSTSTPSSPPGRQGRREHLLCWLMASGRFGCHDLPKHRWGASARWESCRFGLSERSALVTVVAAGVVWVHCTKVGRYWRRVGGASGRWGLRAIDTTLGQWTPTLVEQVDSGPLLTGPASNHDHRAPAQATGRGRWGRTCDGGAGLCRKNLGLTPARSGVHSADISQPGVSALSGDRWNSAVSSPVCSPDSG